jgi:hypothetical protein
MKVEIKQVERVWCSPEHHGILFRYINIMLHVFNLGNHAIELFDIDHWRGSKGNTRQNV